MEKLTPEIIHEKTEKGIHEVFILTMLGKGIFAIFEIVVGAALLFTNSIIDVVLELISNELIEDPSVFFGNWVQPLLHPSPEAQIFAGLYLLSHGVVKLFLIVGLLRNKLWAYPASIAVFTLFIIYQMFRYYFHTHSMWLLVITATDIVILWLIYHEYKQALKRVTISANGPTTSSTP